MTGKAPTIAANCTIFNPTPPTPKTTTDSPMPTCASLLITPSAVVTAQPRSGALRGSMVEGTGVTRFSDTTAYWLKVVTQPAFSFLPFQRYSGVGDCMPLPGRQCITTVSPALQLLTPGPVSITVASASWPSRWGRNLSGPLTESISLI